MINSESIGRLIQNFSDDQEMLDMIFSQLETFEEYHSSIYTMETWMKIYTTKTVDIQDYQYMVEDLDKKRTMRHNSLLTAVNVLNRMCEKEKLPLVYEGIVSTERPHRRVVANAVLEYVEQTIKNRR